ncbi:aerobic-type carbon monoxide dehydrogenase, middle subunit CoxM/CutM-like protein [Cylindrospermum stagnale PCC 7417]|uniref:Aerobic-type carbon monoxide dehydrogenase, middle subunit CoxM/CutM-like protein n=1 Tax=Cylindrospermum stagnale PCC 7417 TaxID=56107 RepID=K9WXU0_9NOST|nr:FAD binding domain-containing protein [Cylindrospermum stagnale]AFZ24629.1 aerobic-type carbon monoxide dehydrogenase, middle subunit CoxM/CutM-like protein [Cylindrospermum stagnale PCC 7417]
MDLPNIETYLNPDNLHNITNWGDDWAWLAGGTWLFSQAQPQLKTLVDIQPWDWSEIELSEDNLIIGATCPLIKLLEYPWLNEFTAVAGLKSAVNALAASFKVINLATVGGNICLALSVGTLAPVMVALGASYEIWNLQGDARQVAAKDFQIGFKTTILQRGEIFRRVLIPVSNLKWQIDYQRFSIAATDSALAIVVTASNHQQVRCVIAASVAAPRLLEFESLETAERQYITDLENENFLADAKASATYRQELTKVLIKRSLSALIELTTKEIRET